MNAIAHISFPGGGVFLPARNPYDRQLLIEHIADRVRAKGEVHVALGRDFWSVRLHPPAARSSCSVCGQTLKAACFHSPIEGPGYCLKCAFGTETPPTPGPVRSRTAA